MVALQKEYMANLVCDELTLLVWDLDQFGYILVKGIPFFLCDKFKLLAF